jgi:hypothetical protein
MAFQFRKAGGAGGYLHGVAGTIVGYSFDAKEWISKKTKNPYTTLSVRLDILQDGAEKPVPQFLQGGFIYDNQTISDDGQTLDSDDDKAIIQEDSEIARFLVSAVEAGLGEDVIQEDLRNLSGLVNRRFTFKRVVDEEGTAQFGKKKSVSKKDGKEYENNRDFLLVGEYHGLVEPVKKGSKKAAATAPKSTAAKGGKANGAAKNAEADALIEQAEGVLLSILADAGKPVDRTGLSSKVVKYSTENPFSEDASEHNTIRESLRKLIGSEDFLKRANGWNFDPNAKGQPVSL